MGVDQGLKTAIFKTMPENFLTVDNFLTDPEQYRASVLALPFVDVRFGSELYRRIQVRDYAEHREKIQQVLKREILPEQAIARLNYDGEMPNHSIHSDNCHGDFAAVLYLNPPEQCRGGTAFWRHKATGLTGFNESQIRQKGKSPAKALAQIEKDWNDDSKWEQTGAAEMKFNRLIIYSSKDFHSRWPFAAFGKTPIDGRLIWASFFSCV